MSDTTWSTIDSAPTDGTQVFLFWKTLLERPIYVGFCLGGQWKGYYGGMVVDVWPTHWCAIPAEPEVEAYLPENPTEPVQVH